MSWLDFISGFDWLQVALVLGGFACLALLFNMQSNGRLYLEDLIKGEDGRASLSKFAQLGAFMVSTWGFVWNVVHDKMTEWYYFSYMVAWCGVALGTKYLANKAAEMPKQEQL